MPRFAAAVGLVVGLSSYLGWRLGLPGAPALHPSLRAMHPNAAVGFVFAAAALLLLNTADVQRRRWALVPALSLAMLGVASWVEVTSAVDFGVDSLFVVRPSGGGSPFMPSGTAANLTLLGVALALATGRSRRAHEGSVVLGLLVAAAAAEGVIGYAWGAMSAFAPAWFRVVAVHSVGTLVILAGGLLTTGPADGPLAIVTEGGGSRFVTRLLPFAVVLRLLLGWLTASGGRGQQYGIQFGLSMFAVANLFMVTAVVTWSSRALAAAERDRLRVARDLEAAREQERQRAALAEALRRAASAQEEERRRIAQELHDGVGSSLAQVLFEMDRWTGRLEDGTEKTGLADLRTRLAGVVGDLGRTARGLHPSVLEDLGLLSALEQYLGEWKGRDEVELDFLLTGLDRARRLPAPVELAAYRIVQEALSNVARHAGARTASVVVRLEADALVVIVEDDGAGFDPETVGKEAASLGLRDMQERVEAVGGTLTLESAPEEGTTVRATLPLSPKAAHP